MSEKHLKARKEEEKERKKREEARKKGSRRKGIMKEWDKTKEERGTVAGGEGYREKARWKISMKNGKRKEVGWRWERVVEERGKEGTLPPTPTFPEVVKNILRSQSFCTLLEVVQANEYDLSEASFIAHTKHIFQNSNGAQRRLQKDHIRLPGRPLTECKRTDFEECS